MSIKILQTVLVVLLLSWSAMAQEQVHLSTWQETTNELALQSGKRNIYPSVYKVYREDIALLKSELTKISTHYDAAKIIELPTPNGDVMSFKIWQTPMMEEALASKYPDIKTFTAEAVANHNITAKIDISSAGFHAMIFNGENTFLIDPYGNEANDYFICYFKKDYPASNIPSCKVLNRDGSTAGDILHQTGNKTHGSQRRKYRLALGCTYEYAQAVGGTTPTKASVLAQMVLIINRVNGVYERELASTMTLVAKTDTLIYLTAADPYTNNDGETMLDENQAIVDQRIGVGNYDIGHVFSTGGGGIAYLGVVCYNDLKAGGVTGMPSPFGDPFAIDYVAHEMGHQFGSDHTFNSCGGYEAADLAFEPGSGSTIMAYAGICGNQNLQQHSDAYFHAASLKYIIDYITNSDGNTCPVITTAPNIPNTYPDFTRSYNIPNWTPFELTAPSVTDATADTLLYCWEEWDLGSTGTGWNGNSNTMPYFRSFNPSASNTRVFPVINKVMANTLKTIGERLPAAARTMKFILTTRDIYQGYGCINSSFDTDTITVKSSNIPGANDTFKVTSQGTATTWNQGSTQTVTWNVGTTTASPVSTSTVNIYLSVDSAQTFPYILASNVPNNGSATVTIPTGLTPNSKTRVKVKGNNNIFFQLNKANITITNTPLAVELSSFDVNKNGCGVDLHWTLTNHDDVHSIQVERSTDGSHYKVIATIPAQQEALYNYKDASVTTGAYQYKIVILKKNGTTTESNAISIHLNCGADNNVVLSPNPAKDILTIQSSEKINKVAVFTATGQRVETKSLLPDTSIQMDIHEFANGIYFLQVVTENGHKQNIKFVKE